MTGGDCIKGTECGQSVGADSRLSVPICEIPSEIEEAVYGGSLWSPNMSTTKDIQMGGSPTSLTPSVSLDAANEHISRSMVLCEEQ